MFAPKGVGWAPLQSLLAACLRHNVTMLAAERLHYWQPASLGVREMQGRGRGTDESALKAEGGRGTDEGAPELLAMIRVWGSFIRPHVSATGFLSYKNSILFAISSTDNRS